MDFMRWRQIKREYEERTGEPWPGFGEEERRRIAAGQAGGDDEGRGVSPIFAAQQRKRRRPWK